MDNEPFSASPEIVEKPNKIDISGISNVEMLIRVTTVSSIPPKAAALLVCPPAR